MIRFQQLLIAGTGALVLACGSDSSKVETTALASSEMPEPAAVELDTPEQPAETAPTYIPGKWVWYELNTNDVEKSKSFYSELLGWSFEERQMGPENKTYVTILNDGAPIGMFQDLAMIADGKKIAKGKKLAPFWYGYISTEDVDASMTRATEAGATVAMPAMDMPEVGRFSVLKDQAGASFGLIKALTGDKPDAMPTKGNLAWMHHFAANEKLAGEVANTYAAAVGYQIAPQKIKNHSVHMALTGTTPRAGFEATKNRKLQGKWIPYVVVENVDESVKLAKQLKSKVLLKPEDLENTGRVAIITDPTGAPFGLFAGNPMPEAGTDGAAAKPTN